MLKLSTVMTSDALSKNNTRFTAGTLCRGLFEQWNTGLPSTTSHDAHRPTGWSFPTGLSIENGVTRLHGLFLIPESMKEQSQINNMYQNYLSSFITKKIAPHIETLKKLLEKRLDGTEQPCSPCATALRSANLARRVAPDIFDMEDKDGLIPLNALEILDSGVFKYKDLVLFPHPYFRRSLSRMNNLNLSLIEKLDMLCSVDGISVKIKLDSDMVGLARSVVKPIELAYWYGPHFSDNLSSITPGVNRHEASEQLNRFHGISRTEFWWQSRAGQHILETEELRDTRTFGGNQEEYGCRYVHSIIDEKTNNIEHLDGAIRMYSEEEMISRLDSDIKEAGRNTVYTKLWRTDGKVPLSDWKLLIYHNFRDNTDIGCYLDSECSSSISTSLSSVKQSSSENLDTAEQSPLLALRQSRIEEHEAVRAMLSIHDLPTKPLTSQRVIRASRSIEIHGSRRNIVESDTIELCKLLRKYGENIELPDTVLRLAYEDFYNTFPLIIHDSPKSVRSTIEAFRELFDAWMKRGNDRVVALSIGMCLDSQELRISLIGHVKAMSKKLSLLINLFECETQQDIVSWVDTFTDLLKKENGSEGHSDIVNKLIGSDQTFRVNRIQVEKNYLEEVSEKGESRLALKLPKDDSELLDAFNNHVLSLYPAVIIHKSTCSSCGLEYSTCSCSKYFDDKVIQKVSDTEMIGLFWTDRPAMRIV